MIYLADLTLNLSQLILWDVAYHSEEILLIYDYDLDNIWEKIKAETSSKSRSRSMDKFNVVKYKV